MHGSLAVSLHTCPVLPPTEHAVAPTSQAEFLHTQSLILLPSSDTEASSLTSDKPKTDSAVTGSVWPLRGFWDHKVSQVAVAMWKAVEKQQQWTAISTSKTETETKPNQNKTTFPLQWKRTTTLVRHWCLSQNQFHDDFTDSSHLKTSMQTESRSRGHSSNKSDKWTVFPGGPACFEHRNWK